MVGATVRTVRQLPTYCALPVPPLVAEETPLSHTQLKWAGNHQHLYTELVYRGRSLLFMVVWLNISVRDREGCGI